MADPKILAFLAPWRFVSLSQAHSDAEGFAVRGGPGDHQCDQAMLVRKEKADAIAKKFGRVVQRVKVPSDQSRAGRSVASLAASAATLGSMRRQASG